jgi:hypothetical protein
MPPSFEKAALLVKRKSRERHLQDLISEYVRMI